MIDSDLHDDFFEEKVAYISIANKILTTSSEASMHQEKITQNEQTLEPPVYHILSKGDKLDSDPVYMAGKKWLDEELQAHIFCGVLKECFDDELFTLYIQSHLPSIDNTTNVIEYLTQHPSYTIIVDINKNPTKCSSYFILDNEFKSKKCMESRATQEELSRYENCGEFNEFLCLKGSYTYLETMDRYRDRIAYIDTLYAQNSS